MQRCLSEIVVSDFISLEDSRILQSKVFGLMENMDKERKSLTIPLDSSCQEIFNENMDIFEKHMNQKIVFFHRQAMDIGAIEINTCSVMDNMDYIISESEMYRYGCRILLVNKDIKYGFCLWRGEYEYRLYKW
jgi:hypothetical protein